MNTKPTTGNYVIEGHEFAAPALPPGLHVVATPLGNLNDISLRALKVLAGANIVLCEDTRITSRLMQRYYIDTPLKPYHDHNAVSVRPAILDMLEAGEASLALVSDAGMPLVNDPGYKLVTECIERNIPVDVVPGPTAPVTALALSGLPSDRFLFAGFLPAKETARACQLQELSKLPSTLIVFESPSRLGASLRTIAGIMGSRQIAVVREMTKIHQEALRGTATEILEQLADRPSLKGEITMVIAPPQANTEISDDELSADLEQLLTKMPPAKAASQLAKQTGKQKSEIYKLATRLKAAKP